MGKLISWYHPAFVKCGMFIKHPTITFAAFMKLKSDVSVVSLSVEDPASHDGMIRIVEKLITYLPKLPSQVNQKTLIFGDQLYVERGHSASWGRCGEKDSRSKLDGVIFCPQEWHKKKEDLMIYNERFNLSHQVDSPGTLQNIRNSFGHLKAAKDVKDFYPAWDLAEVTTLINLITLVCSKTGLGLESIDASYSEEMYEKLVRSLLDDIDLLGKWEEDNGETDIEEQDFMQNFHKDLLFYGLMNLAQKFASQHGDGEAILAMWKNSLSDYQDAQKPKYRICAHRKIAACSGVFGAKIQVDALHNCFINDQGLKHTNVDGDLKVEHCNGKFKAGLLHLCGNYTEDCLQRVAKSLNARDLLQERLTPSFVDSDKSTIEHYHGHRTADWKDQVTQGVRDLSEKGVFEFKSGREMPGAHGYKRKDRVDFKGLKSHIKRYSRELDYYIKVLLV